MMRSATGMRACSALRCLLPLLLIVLLGFRAGAESFTHLRVYEPPPPPQALLPPPQEAELGEAAFVLTPKTPLYLAADRPELYRAAVSFADEVRDRYGTTMEVRVGGPPRDRGIWIGTADYPVFVERLRRAGLDPVDRPEGYALLVDENGAVVVGSDGAGAFYGVQTLRQLVAVRDGRVSLRSARIRDWPALAWRMAMLYLDRNADVLTLRLLPLLAKYKFNRILVVSNYLCWDSATSIRVPQCAPKELVRRITQTAREHLLEPVPLLETLGHVEWLFANGQNRDLLEDARLDHTYVYDPTNPRVYEVLFPIVDEVVDVFRPRYVHIGHDEVRNRVPFPYSERGRRVGFVRLFLDDVQKLYGHLKARGVGTMMWQDVLLAGEGDRILAELPRDILIADWHYTPAADYPSLRRLREAGFQVIGASWSKPENITSFARAAKRHGALGMLQTRWSGYFGDAAVLRRDYPQVYAYLVASSAFWNPDAPIPDDPAARFRWEWMPPPPRDPAPGVLVDLSRWANRSLADPDGRGWLGKGPEFDLRDFPQGEVRLGGVLFRIGRAVRLRGRHPTVQQDPARVEIPVGAPAQHLCVLHVTGWPGRFGEEVGRYIVRYADGSQEVIPLRYAQEIAAWTDTETPSIDLRWAWRGRTRNGLEVGVVLFCWANPRPEGTIRSIELISAAGMPNPILLGLSLVRGTAP